MMNLIYAYLAGAATVYAVYALHLQPRLRAERDALIKKIKGGA